MTRRNIRLLIAFDGTDFKGWQRQPAAPTIQGEIEKHLSTISNQHTDLHGAGRTDAGVHAAGMVAHFQTEKNLSCLAFQKALNSMLPESIRILQATEEPISFHSRFSAKGKTYIYSLFNGPILLPQDRYFTMHVRSQLDFSSMKECLHMLIGTHDFGCFETAGSRDLSIAGGKGSIRTISEADFHSSRPDFYDIVISGDGFLRHMVRNIVGTTLEVGLGTRTIDNFRETLISRKRSKAGSTAPARALTLKKIYY